MINLSFKERRAIKKGLELVSKKYQLPKLLFYQNKEIISNGCYGGLVTKDEEKLLPKNFPKEKYTKYHLIVFAGWGISKKNFEWDKEFDKYGHVHYKSPMIGTIIHEVGHAYFEIIHEKEKLISIFTKIDNDANPGIENGEKLVSHASSYSEFFCFSKEWKEKRMIMRSLNEQFAETFTYIILDHTYKKDDPFFQRKKHQVLELLKKYK